MKSIFRLEEIRSYGSEEHWYRDASIGIVGHYSSLEKVMEAIRENNQETWDAEEIMAYLVKEIDVDSIWGEVDCLSIRSFNAQGSLIDQCLQNYNLCNQFEGRNPEAIRFHVGDIVEVLEGRLYTAIVAALPPTPEDHFPILDALDDCYLVLPMDSGPIDHLHIAPTHTFTLQHPIEKEGLDYLRNRLLFYQGRQDEVDMRAICEIEGHQYLYNYVGIPPSKCICRRCHQKWRADYSGDLIHGEIWHEVDAFEGETRTDEEIIKDWGGH